MTGYTKLFGSIIASTIWREDDKTRIVWITMLAMKNRDDIVEASMPGLADMARVSVAECQKALEKLSSPDPHSRSKENKGRRIRAVDGGWLILNGAKYRSKMNADERREYLRIKKQESRERAKIAVNNESTNVNNSQQSQHKQSTESESEAESERGNPPSRRKFPSEAIKAVDLIKAKIEKLRENGKRGPDGKLTGLDADEWKRLKALLKQNEDIACGV